MSQDDYQAIKALIRDMEATSKVLEDVRGKLAAAIEREVAGITPYTVLCNRGYDWGEFIVRVFNVTDTQIEDVVERLLDDMGVAAMADVWTYSPYETKRHYPAYYKEVKP